MPSLNDRILNRCGPMQMANNAVSTSVNCPDTTDDSAGVSDGVPAEVNVRELIAADDEGTSAPSILTAEQYKYHKELVEAFERQTSTERKLTPTHRSMLNNVITTQFFAACKFADKGDLMISMRPEMEFLFEKIDIETPHEKFIYAKDLQ